MRTSPQHIFRATLSGIAVIFVLAISLVSTQAANAVANPQPVSAFSVSAGGNGDFSLGWTNPVTDFDHVVITTSPGNQTYSCACSSVVISGLISGETYTFTAVAYSPDPAFYSTPSTVTSTGVGNTVPAAPASVTGIAGNASLTLSWTAPSANGGSAISSYTATLNTGQTCTTAAMTCVISGLTNGTPYTATVTATNTTGTSAASAASATITPAAETLATTGTALVLPLGIASASAILGIWVLLRRRQLVR